MQTDVCRSPTYSVQKEPVIGNRSGNGHWTITYRTDKRKYYDITNVVIKKIILSNMISSVVCYYYINIIVS